MKLLYVVTEDWYFVSHRLALAAAALAAGFEVAVATRPGRHADTIRSAGIRLIPFELSRRGGNPVRESFALWRLYRREKPDLVHHVALKPVMLGSFAAWLAQVPARVNAVAGLGWLFTSSDRLVRLVRPLFRRLLALLLSQSRSLTIVQNPEDGALLERSGVPARQLRLIRGAGVDTKAFAPAIPQGLPVTIVLVSRMLWDKGIGDFVEAAKRLNQAGPKARFLLIGEPDPGNPAAVPESALKGWHGHHGIEWWGRRDDIPAILQSAHIACLPSCYGEGIPKSLLEAAACGLPIVTTDTPGCREVVSHGDNGLLVPKRDPEALQAALELLVSDPALRQRMGARSRERAEIEFEQGLILSKTLALYKEVCE